MKRRDAVPLKPPRLSLAAAARILETLGAVDTHENYIFSATAPVMAERRNGDLVEIGTTREIMLVCQQALGGGST